MTPDLTPAGPTALVLPEPYRLRRYAPTDFDAVAALAVDASADPERACGQPDVGSAAEFAADFGHRNLGQEAWVITEGDAAVVGFAAGAARAKQYALDGPIVHLGHGGKGLGSILLEAVAGDARAVGATSLEGGVRASNLAGQVFLRRHGFKPTREIHVYETEQAPEAQVDLPPGYALGDLEPRKLLPFLMVMHECFPAYRLPSAPEALFDPTAMKIFLVEDEEGRPVGGVTAYYYPEDRLGYVYHLGVTEPHRRRGLARSMLTAATQWLFEAHQPRCVGVSTGEAVPLRHSLIEPLGFTRRYALIFMGKRP